MQFSHFVFDAYGTLFDIHSAVMRHINEIGADGVHLSEIWRAKQLEYSWTRACMNSYKPFWQLTVEALDFAFEVVPGVDKNLRDKLLEAYQTLDCYEEVPAVLTALKDGGAKTAILSNGSPDMLNSAIASAGLGDKLDEVFSVDQIATFKTMPETYEMVTRHFDVEAENVVFCSSNRWDIAGASVFGFHCVWINRTNQPDEYSDLAPERIMSNLNGLIRISEA